MQLADWSTLTTGTDVCLRVHRHERLFCRDKFGQKPERMGKSFLSRLFFTKSYRHLLNRMFQAQDDGGRLKQARRWSYTLRVRVSIRDKDSALPLSPWRTYQARRAASKRFGMFQQIGKKHGVVMRGLDLERKSRRQCTFYNIWR